MKLKSLFTYLVIAVLFLASCEKKDPEIPNEEELITSVFLRLVPEGGGPEVLLSFQDFDGDGGEDPIIKGGQIEDGVKYFGTLEFYNEAVFPVVDMTDEIREEGDEHQVFYEIFSSNIDVEYLDQDVNGNPIGLLASFTANGAPSKGSITIILKHLPEKPNDGLASSAGGETDIEVSLGISIVN